MRVKVRGWNVRSPIALRGLGSGVQAGSRVGCQEAHCAEGKWCWVKSQESHLYYVRQGCVEHNQVREKGAKVGDWTWGQFLWHPELQSLSAITDPIKLHPLP